MQQGFQNIWIFIFLIFLRLSRHFQSLLFWVHKHFSLRPLKLLFLLREGPWLDSGTEQGRSRRFPARRVAGGGGPAGEKREGLKGYLWVGSVHREMAGVRLSTGAGGRRRVWPPAARFRRRWRWGDRPRSFSGGRGRSWRGRFEQWGCGGAASRQAQLARRQWRAGQWSTRAREGRVPFMAWEPSRLS